MIVYLRRNRNPTVLNDLWLKSSMSTLWFTLSPHVTVHTHAQMKSASYWRHTRAYESACTHTYARAQAEEILWFDYVARRHFPQCIQFRFHPRRSRKKSCDVLTEMITILFFTSGVLFYWYRKWRQTPNKQTAKVGRKTSARQQTSKWETRHVTG